MSNAKFIGSITTEKEEAFEAYKNMLLDGNTLDQLDKATQSLVLTVLTNAYAHGWMDCHYTVICKINELES
jgi:hypothetical protein